MNSIIKNPNNYRWIILAVCFFTITFTNGLTLGGLVVFDETVDMGEQARFAMEFCAIESCGKCTPCRIGAVRGVEVIDRILGGVDEPGNLVLLRELCDTMVVGSLCALGGMAPFPVLSVMNHFPEDLRARGS